MMQNALLMSVQFPKSLSLKGGSVDLIPIFHGTALDDFQGPLDFLGHGSWSICETLVTLVPFLTRSLVNYHSIIGSPIRKNDHMEA